MEFTAEKIDNDKNILPSPNRNGRVLAWQVTQICMADFTYPSLFRNRIVTMATAPPNNLVTIICDNVFSLTASQRDAIVNNGWDRLDEFQGFNYYMTQTWERESNRLPASHGGCYFGSVATENIQVLAYWANQMLLRGYTLVCDGFDAETMRKFMDDAEIHYAK